MNWFKELENKITDRVIDWTVVGCTFILLAFMLYGLFEFIRSSM